jgi:trk system potassium uptake protein TrkH
LLLTILVFTLIAELIGAALLSGLWSDLPWGERTYQSIFHSVSAFCNAGFSLTSDSFVGLEHRWQIWFGTTSLIITGGLGFGVFYNLYRLASDRWNRERISTRTDKLLPPPRLGITTRLVLWTTVVLLGLGTIGVYLLESIGPGTASSGSHSWANAWFQSVTFRTAGFNTIDLGQWQTTTKLFAIALMFIGASPGSTGGGVKTVCIAVILLSMLSLLRGKERVELGHRRIPTLQIERAYLIVTLGIGIVMVTTFLLVLFEQKPHRLIDHLFEATSAFGTVGLSTGITSELSSPSRVVIILTMLIGRVGPLTLMLALATRQQTDHYDLPEERVVLG